jgi:hypothetical protein
MKWFVFLYDLHKTEETLLNVMKIWSERITDPILTVQGIFHGLYRCCY